MRVFSILGIFIKLKWEELKRFLYKAFSDPGYHFGRIPFVLALLAFIFPPLVIYAVIGSLALFLFHILERGFTFIGVLISNESVYSFWDFITYNQMDSLFSEACGREFMSVLSSYFVVGASFTGKWLLILTGIILIVLTIYSCSKYIIKLLISNWNKAIEIYDKEKK